VSVRHSQISHDGESEHLAPVHIGEIGGLTRISAKAALHWYSAALRRWDVAEPTITTIKKLFALSSNRCAFPGCQNCLFEASGALIGRVCHICADRPGGKRYDPNQTEAERQGFDNLILLCANHHILIDDDDVTYTVEVLREMKRRHEESSTGPFEISDQTAQRIILAMTAGAAGAGIGEVVREVMDFARALANALGPPEEKKPDDQGDPLVRDLENILRYAPKGQVAYDSDDDAHRKVGAFFSEVFKRGGWRAATPHPNVRTHPWTKDARASALLMFFVLQDSHQVHIARQAIDQVFERCGFRRSEDAGRTNYKSKDASIRIYFHIGLTRQPSG